MKKGGFVTLLGQPNSGKSTLVNTLVGEKVAIISPRPQTTRRRICGIVNYLDSQIILVDSPGVIHSSEGINAYLEQEWKEAVHDCDILLALLNVDEPNISNIENIIELAKNSSKEWLAVMTKIDLGFDHRISIIKEKVGAERLVPISCKRDPEKTKKVLLQRINELLPTCEFPLYDQELYTTASVRELTSELIREKCFLKTHHEVPYSLAVKILSYKEEAKIIKINAEIWVSKEGHKAILIGKNGQNIKEIGILARKDIEELVGQKVFLDLHVKIKEKWSQNPLLMKDLGYGLSK